MNQWMDRKEEERGDLRQEGNEFRLRQYPKRREMHVQ